MKTSDSTPSLRAWVQHKSSCELGGRAQQTATVPVKDKHGVVIGYQCPDPSTLKCTCGLTAELAKLDAALAAPAVPKEREQLQALRDEFDAALVIMRNYYAQAISRAAVDEILDRGWKMIKQTDDVLAAVPQQEQKS